MLYDQDTIEHDGSTFRVRLEPDDTMGPPWEEEAGHGVVSGWTTRAKRPGERLLVRDRHWHRYYDVQESMFIALRDGWDAPPLGTGTKGQRAARAVDADFERLRRFCNNDWYWVSVSAELLDDQGAPTGESAVLWGIENDAGEYLEEAARELASEVLDNLKAAAA